MGTQAGQPGVPRRRLLVGGLAVAGAAGLSVLAGPTREVFSSRAPCLVRAAVESPGALVEPSHATAPGWHLDPADPVLTPLPASDWETYSVYDVWVERMPDGSLAMWYSTAGVRGLSICLAVDPSGAGNAWTRVAANPVLTPEDPEQHEVGRPSLIRMASDWRMWYTKVVRHPAPDSASPASWIETATSSDGLSWLTDGVPVLEPRDAWEGVGLACSNVRADAASGLYHMWYGGVFPEDPEPHAVGLATSSDGIHWLRYEGNPVFTASTGWEDYLIGSSQAVHVDDWFYAFYLGSQREPYTARIGMARSRDGVSGWEKHPDNPILGPGKPCNWNAAMVYKPAPLWDAAEERWHVWFNASAVLNTSERIGHAWSDRVW